MELYPGVPTDKCKLVYTTVSCDHISHSSRQLVVWLMWLIQGRLYCQPLLEMPSHYYYSTCVSATLIPMCALLLVLSVTCSNCRQLKRLHIDRKINTLLSLGN